MESNLVVRSSSAEFLIFERQSHSEGIQVRFEEGDLWLTQKGIGKLFDTTRNNITMHLQDIYSNYELDVFATSKDFLLVQKEGNREVKRKVKYYNLDAVISVGYRVNSDRAVQFRRWATNVLKEFSKKGYIIDKKRMENGTFFDEDYFDSLLADDRDILKDAGKISHEIACDKTLCEYEKYRVKQDKLYKSDFDLLLEEMSK